MFQAPSSLHTHPKGAAVGKCDCSAPFMSTDHMYVHVGPGADEELMNHLSAVRIYPENHFHFPHNTTHLENRLILYAGGPLCEGPV